MGEMCNVSTAEIRVDGLLVCSFSEQAFSEQELQCRARTSWQAGKHAFLLLEEDLGGDAVMGDDSVKGPPEEEGGEEAKERKKGGKGVLLNTTD